MSLVDNGSPWECRGQWRESWSIDDDDDDEDKVMLNVLRCQLTYLEQAETNA